jgi:hypothetical protein
MAGTPLALSTVEVGAVAVFGVLALGLGGGLVYDAVRSMRFRQRARTEFERVDATVVDSAVHEPAGGGRKAVPHVEYEYTVDGEPYTSRSLWPTRSPSPDSVDRSVARRIVEDHRDGAESLAHYDPEDPATAYKLEQFDRTGDRIELSVGAALLLGFLGLVVVLAVLV